MAREIVVLDRSRNATSSLATSQFCGVVLDTTAAAGGGVVLPSAGVAIYGVVQNAPGAGQSAEVRVLGVTKMLVGSGGVTAGDKVTVDSAGAAVTAATTNYVCGFAEDTAAATTYTTVLLLPGGRLP